MCIYLYMYIYMYIYIYIYIHERKTQCAYVLRRRRQQTLNQEFFSAGKVSENKGTSINI